MPQDLHSCWAWVRKGLEEVIEHSRDNWIPEDVYTAVRNASAYLYIADNEGGFCVFTLLPGYSGALELHVWCAHGSGGDLEAESACLDEVARSLGCQSITFFSPRNGWRRNKLGYEEVHTLYRKKV